MLFIHCFLLSLFKTIYCTSFLCLIIKNKKSVWFTASFVTRNRWCSNTFGDAWVMEHGLKGLVNFSKWGSIQWTPLPTYQHKQNMAFLNDQKPTLRFKMLLPCKICFEQKQWYVELLRSDSKSHKINVTIDFYFKCCSFHMSIYQRLLKNCHVSTKY